MTPLAALVLAVLCGVVLFAPRRYALLAIFVAILFLSQRGGLELGGLRMHSGRFLELAGIIRVISRREFSAVKFGQLDRAVLLTYTFVTVVWLTRTLLGSEISASIKMVSPLGRVGEFVDVILGYLVFRSLLQNLDDVRWLFRRCVPLVILMAACLVVERVTYRNPLVVLGSNPSVWFDDFIDGGRIRCYGAFAHPALLGTVGVWMAIIYVSFASYDQDRKKGLIAIGLCLTIALLGSSGGPLTSFAAGLLGWACWLIRQHMRAVRITIVVGLVLLAIVMKDPIWYLPSKMSVVFGGTGWHRSYLMNQAITHMYEWWLMGMSLQQTVNWFSYLVLGAADITNLYVAFGIDGGLAALILLIWMITLTFRYVGRSLRKLQADPGSGADQLLVWGLGCGVLVHVVNYISTTYFDQTNWVWLFQLAAVAAISQALGVEQHSPSKRRQTAAQARARGSLPHPDAAGGGARAAATLRA